MGARSIRFAASMALAAALAASAAAQARTFYVVRSGPDTRTVMDPQAIETVPGTTLRRAWSVTIQRNMHSPGIPPQPGYLRTLTEFDCERRLTRWRSLSAFSAAGVRLVAEDNKSVEWTPAEATGESLVAFRVRGSPPR